MVTLLLALTANAAEPPDLATRIKHGLKLKAADRHGVHIESIHLFGWVVRMEAEDLRAALAEPLQVGTVLTRNHGRLRLTCGVDRCTAALGDTEIALQLEDPEPEKRRR